MKKIVGNCFAYKERTPIDCKSLQDTLRMKYDMRELPVNMLPVAQLEAILGALLGQMIVTENKNFEYNNNVARLLTLDEARKVCATNKDGFIKVENCKYLLENTGYATGNEKSYWLETRSSVQPTAAWWIDGNTGYNAVYESDNGVRPVIEILKSEITY